jgi:hypothetical protein
MTPKTFIAPTTANAVYTMAGIGGRSECYPEILSATGDTSNYFDVRTLKNSTAVGNGHPLWGNGYSNGVRAWATLQGSNLGGVSKLGWEIAFASGGYIYGARVYYCY